MTRVLNIGFAVLTCSHEERGRMCGVTYALTDEHVASLRNNQTTFYCPAGHPRWYPPEHSDAHKLKLATARETALRDQLSAAIRDAEAVRVALVRDRHRFANGCCPCCNRYFANVHRHMTVQHPDYDVTKVKQPAIAKPYRCSCGDRFETPRGLAIHQGHRRKDFLPDADWHWDSPKAPDWAKHLTVV